MSFEQVQALNAEQRALREIYRSNRYLLAKDLLGFNDLTVSFHYKNICVKLNEPRKKMIRLWLIPRGFFKTTILTITDSVALQLNKPDIRIAIISAVMANAKSMVTATGIPYLNNPAFRQYFPEYCPKKPLAPETKWTESEIHVPNRGGRPMMEGTYEAFGADSTLTSRHFDYIKVDDLVTRENSTTRDQMDKIKQFYRAIFPLRNGPDTPIDIIGTRWDDYDLYGDLEKDPDVEVIKFPAWEIINGTKVSTWPERYPVQELESIRSGPKMGSYLFSCLYLQDPIPQEDAIFKNKWWKYFSVVPDRSSITRDDGVKIPIGDTFMTIDGATEEGKNDSSAIMVGFKDSEENIYILDYYNKQADPVNFLTAMEEYYFKWQCLKFAGQKSVIEKMLKSFLRLKQRQEKFFMRHEELGANTRMNKEFSIKQLQPWYEGGFIWHNRWMKGGELESQLERFPKARHDDLPDVEQMLLEIIRPSSKATTPENFDRNSLHMWKRRLKRSLGKFPSNSQTALINERTY